MFRNWLNGQKAMEGIWDAPEQKPPANAFLRDLKQLDDQHSGAAKEAPRYVKNILARLRELPLHDREVCLEQYERIWAISAMRYGARDTVKGEFEGEWVKQQLKDADKIRCELNRVKTFKLCSRCDRGARGNSSELEDALYAHEHRESGNGIGS